MDQSQRINKWLEQSGCSQAEVKKMIDSGLGTLFLEIHDSMQKEVAAFVDDLKKNHDLMYGNEPWNENDLKHLIELSWTDHFSKFMSKRIHDLLGRVAESKILPGVVKEGHYRTPNKKDVLAGKSGNPFQDLCMAMFIESSERKKK